MAMKSLDDWIKAWDDASGSSGKKTYALLRQYVIDSNIDVAGVLSSATWFVVSNRQNTQYLSSKPVKRVLSQVLFDHDVGFFLWHVKKSVNEFYRNNFPDIAGICEGDELLHVLQVIKEKTDVDYSKINIDELKREESSSPAHV